MGNSPVRRPAGFVVISIAALLASGPAGAEHIMVFAAASLKRPLTETARAHEAASGNRVRISFAASSALARQIDAGAPADLYVSANAAWINWLLGRGKIQPASRTTLAGNRLVLVAPNPAPVLPERFTATSALRLLQGGRIALADPRHVPAGIYARQALTSLGAWSRLAPYLAPAANVRAALALVERGATPLGIVYASDAHGSSAVDVIYRFSRKSHAPIRYVAALVANARPATADFLAALAAGESRKVFRKYAFSAD